MATNDIPIMDWTNPNPAEAFKLFKQKMEFYFILNKTKPELQVTNILMKVGDIGLKRYNSWTLTEEEKRSPEFIFNKFLQQLEPKDNIWVNRLKLISYRQKNEESIDDFVNRCRRLTQRCEMSEREQQQRIIELIAASTPMDDYQKELLKKDINLTLEEALEIGKMYEASNAHIKQIKNIQGNNNEEDTTAIQAIGPSTQRRKATCLNCGRSHAYRREACPAYGATCNTCGRANHWASVCLSRSRPAPAPQNRKYHKTPQYQKGQFENRRLIRTDAIDNTQELEEELENLTFNSIKIASISQPRDEAFTLVKIKLNNRKGIHKLRLKIDTGAQGNTLPVNTFCRMFPESLNSDGLPKWKTNQAKLVAYNGTPIKCYGSINIPCQYKESDWYNTTFYIVDVKGPAVLGLPSLEQLKLVTLHCEIKKRQINTIEELIQEYPDRFDKIGSMPGSVKLTVNEKVPPHIDAPRKTPIAIADTIKQELDHMVKDNIIKKVTKPTDWVSSLAYSHKKDGSLRICLDPRHLNTALKRPHHRIPTLEELTHHFAGAKIFSKLDAKAGYWSIHLDKDSQLLTTFQSPYGRYCFQRLPFGLSVSQDIFQMKMDQILEQVDGAVGIADDVAVYAKSEEEHDKTIHRLMEVAKENGIVFNSKKCKIKCKSISFYGMRYSENGVSPDPEKISDLQNMTPPTCKKELQEFLGLLTYLSPFISNLADKTHTLRGLLKKESMFLWEEHHKQCFENLKKEISKNSTLTFFNTNMTPTLETDASLKGLGAALMQNEKPIAYASKSLSDTEKRYACIERELLAIVFGVNRFHTYLYGRQFRVLTDHKPLVMILQKPLTSAPPRLQRMMLKLQGYQIHIEYRPGKEMTIADTLSRLPSTENQDTIDLDIRIDLVRFSSDRLQDMRKETERDPVLSLLNAAIITGWPDSIKELPPDIRSYWSYRDELSVSDGIILKGTKIVVPETQQKTIMDQLHYSHQGIEKTRLQARDAVYWKGINNDIENMINKCSICQENLPAQPKETLIAHDIPNRAWEVVGTDLFHFNDHEYLIIADYYSKFPIIRKMTGQSTSNMVIAATKQVFSEQGIPSKVISDNGPQYSSEAYKVFAKQWQFDHVTSSPRFPKSNGFVERQIQTVKRTLLKTKQAGRDPDLAMLCLRTTPIDHNLPSPAELLNNRDMGTITKANTSKQRYSNPDHIREELEKRQKQQKRYYDRTAHDLPPLPPGQTVRVLDQQKGKWTPAIVLKKCLEPRSYILKFPDGSIKRRNRVQIRKTLTTTNKQVLSKDHCTSPQRKTHTNTNDIHNQHYPKQPTPKTTRSGRLVHIPTRYKK